MKKALLAALLLAAAAGFWWQRTTGERPPAVATFTQPDTMPAARMAFTLPDLAGEPRDLSEWQGQPRLLNFWATWCAPCRREIPLLKQVQEQHGAEGLQVIGIAVDHREDVLAYAESARFNYPVLVGQEEAIAAAETSGISFTGLPVTMLLSADGDLLKVHLGEIHAEQIERMIAVVGQLEDGDLDLAGARAALGRL